MVVHEPVNLNLLATNTEAHDISIQSGGGTREYDPARDVIYLGSWDTLQYFTSVCCGRAPEPWVADVRHLALSLDMSDSGLWLPIALCNLPLLETLSVVYPAASGTFDCHDTVPLPANPATALDLLTDEERAELTVNADYLYETHGSDIRIVWTKNADEHLKIVEDNLVRDADWRGTRPPIWDHARGRLKLKYQAKVFRPLRLKPYGSARDDERGV